MSEQESRNDLTFSDFSKALGNRSDYCSSCKYFDRPTTNNSEGYCSKYNEKRSPRDESCSNWRLKY